VRSAGGWLCDRARAGWDVNVLVADGGDPQPLMILGATALDQDEGFLSIVRSASGAPMSWAPTRAYGTRFFGC